MVILRFVQLAASTARITLRNMAKPNVVFVLGGPGAGKGTQCEKIVKKFGYVHLSAGELLRAERSRQDSKVGQMIEKHIKEGSIVPVEITCGLLEKAIVENGEHGRTNFLVDGFPRNQDNLDGWKKQMGDKVNVKFVLFFDCKDEVCVERCLARGAGGSGRSDDNVESLKKRLATYHDSTRPIIEYYAGLDSVHTIDASKSVEEIFAAVEQIF